MKREGERGMESGILFIAATINYKLNIQPVIESSIPSSRRLAHARERQNADSMEFFQFQYSFNSMKHLLHPEL